MFHWSINLTDKQVLMLLAFFSAEDDQHGSRFQAVSAMISDAWDTRAARNLQENGLINVYEKMNEETNIRMNVWNITEKGILISLAIHEDTQSLQHIALRHGQAARSIVDRDANERFFRKRDLSAKRKCCKCHKVIGPQDKYKRTGGNKVIHHNCEEPTSYA